MKRIILFILILIFTAAPCSADEPVKVFLDGEELLFDVPPVISEGRTMVPLRRIAESCGYNVTWNESTQRIGLGKDDVLINLNVGKDIIYVRDKFGSREYVLEVAPFIVNGRTMVPLRAISEHMGYDVTWDEGNRAVLIVSKPLIDLEKNESAG